MSTSTRHLVWLFFYPFLFYSFSSAFGGSYNLLYRFNGSNPGNNYGLSVADAGDVDGDGKADFIFRTADSVYVYSGANGSKLHQISSEIVDFPHNFTVAGAGDVNGDGKADFIIGSPTFNSGRGVAYVYSGATGALLFQKGDTIPNELFGRSVSGAGDVNGDGKADFIVGQPQNYPVYLVAGSAFVYSGADGALLYQKDGDTTGYKLGWSVSGAGDVNGDGKADFIVGAVGGDLVNANDDNAGRAYVYSGATGGLLYQKIGAAPNDSLGASVAGGGDVDGDGKADFIIGAVGVNVGADTNAGSAYVYSGATGNLLYQKNGSTKFGGFGNSVSNSGDVNGDGKADFLIADHYANSGGISKAGAAYLYSGADGSLLFQKNGAAEFNLLGNSVAISGEMNGDGKKDFIIGAPWTEYPGKNGTVFVYSFCIAAKGDMNADESLTPADVVMLLVCVFNSPSGCDFCYSDVNCDGTLSPSDVVLELLAVFSGQSLPCDI